MKVINEFDLSLAKNSLDQGHLVIFPTETVYGLGANALEFKAVDKIFAAKNRASNNPLIVHLKSVDEIEKYAYITNDIEKKLIDNFMPGPFTLILKKKDIIPSNVTCNMDTVGIRVPVDRICHNLLDILDYPIAAPSANLSTRPSGTRVDDIFNEFNDRVDYIIDGGESLIGLESTVCKVIDNVPVILRPGFITKEDIIDLIGCCRESEFLFKKATGKVESPGMLYKHYAPKTECVLVDSDRISEIASNYSKPIIIGSSKNSNINCFSFLNYGDDLNSISHNVFHLLRDADKLNGDIIIIEATKREGLGLAIMNRMIRTCSYHYIRNNEDN